jgi:hypothetical protein
MTKKPGRPKGTKSIDPTTQRNVRVKDSKYQEITEAGKLQYDSFSTYINRLIDSDLLTSK